MRQLGVDQGYEPLRELEVDGLGMRKSQARRLAR